MRRRTLLDPPRGWKSAICVLALIGAATWVGFILARWVVEVVIRTAP
jgi:hypothetical protein